MKTKTVTDAEIMTWVAEVRSNPEHSNEARERLVSFLRPRMRAYAAKYFPELVSAYADPSDVTQEALIRVDSGYDQFHGSTVGQLVAFAQHKVRGRIKNLLEKHSAAKRGGKLRQVHGSAGDDILQTIANRDFSAGSLLSRAEAKRAAIESLPSEMRTVVTLLWISGKSAKEIAEEEGFSVEAVGRLERQALRALPKIRKDQDADKSK